MDSGTYRSKTFFGSFHLPGLIFGAFCLVTIIAWADGRRGEWEVLPVIGFVLALPLVRFIRVKEKTATLYCGVIPCSVAFADIAGMEHQVSDMRFPDSPGVIHFNLRNGRRRRWELKFFSPAVREKIKRELEARLRVPAPEEQSPPPLPCEKSLQEWLRRATGNNADKAVLGLAALLLLGLGGFKLGVQFNWNRRLKNWTVVEGTITRNATKRVRSGKRTRTVADVEYVYTYKRGQYRGNRILYDEDHFPSNVKPGAKWDILVDPESPRRSAVIITYRGRWGSFRYAGGAALLVLGGISFFLFLNSLPPQKAGIPPELAAYLAGLSQPPRVELDKKKTGRPPGRSGIHLGGMPEYRLDRYCILSEGGRTAQKIILAVVFLPILPSIFLGNSSGWLLLIVWSIFLAAFLFLPRRTVIDFQRKQMFWVRTFSPDKTPKRTLSIAGWDRLLLCRGVSGNAAAIILAGVGKDGKRHPVCCVRPRKLALLLAAVPELARRLGNLPVDFR
ncbi:MAG: DUF3592 domain-containing protein [Lentisphaeria bacterium]|nr:DUF3592 domain-containing protein [Lentisphaeria bacterium]